jgi:hypothetical protein
MDVQITDQQVILAQKYRHYWDLYQSQQYLRLTPQATADLQAILNKLGRPHTNWWCADCVKSSLSYIYQQVDAYIAANDNAITYDLNAPTNPEQ